MKNLSLQWRITLMTALLIGATCIFMNVLIGYSGRHYMDSIGSHITGYEDTDGEEPDSFDPRRESLDQELTIVIHGAQESFIATNWYITAAITLLSGILAHFVSGRALRPLRRFAQQAAQVETSNLSDIRLDEKTLPELRSLACAINEMLERLSCGFDAQRQFVGNAAHELRTPLTLLQTQLELFSDEHPDILPESAEFLASLQEQIDAAERELETLQEQSASDTKAVTVSAPGYFSGTVDGYESVLTVDALETMTAQDYPSIAPETPDSEAIGKLIHGDTWYYVTLVPAADAKDVEAGDPVQVTFARDFYVPITMTVRRIGGNEAGYRLLVLESDEYMQNVTMLRQQSADVVFASYSGLRVPKDAVRVNENGKTGVYILEGAVARWKPINILHDNGESYVAALDKSSTNNLWPGDEIIVGAKDLYNGKVVSGYGTEQ